jgi:hypothetical protein
MSTDRINRAAATVLSIPRPRLRTAWRIWHYGFGGIIILALGAFLLKQLLSPDSPVGRGRGLLAAAIGLCFLVALVRLIILPFALKRPFAVLETGLEFQGQRIPWDEIDSCQWGRYMSGTLTVRTRQTRVFVQVPSCQHAEVEATLRRVGKWQA